MRPHSRIACISAAVAALICGRTTALATDLTWDIDPGTPGAQDGSSNWDTTSNTWFDGVNNVTWNNATPDSAFFGNATSTYVGTTTPNNINVNEPITVQNLVLGVAADGSIYNLSDFGGALTLAGNVTKTTDGGNPQLLLTNNGLTLTAGNHVFATRDTPGDANPELAVNGTISGAGGVTMDNGAYEAWGSVAFNPTADNTYTGATNVNHGRLIINTSSGLGATSAGTTIANSGTVAIGGAGTSPASNLNIAEPITITRNTYSGGEFGRYQAAVIFSNTGTARSHTISGPLVIDSTDARIQVDTNTLTISSNITEGPSVTPGTGVLVLGGDFAGFVNLTGNNTGIGTGGIALIGGVELNVSNDNNLGGATAPLYFLGNATLHPVGGWMTDFGSHPINNASFSGGIDVEAGQTFNINQALGGTATAVGSLGKRGTGTMNLTATINLRGGQSYWDGGIVNVNSDVTLASLHLRSPVVNVPTGGKITLTDGNSSWGESSDGTNGGPDKATLNITGTGQVISNWTGDFYLSDGNNTEGTINLKDSGTLTISGLMHVARNPGAKGTINQEGGTFNLTRNHQNFTLVLGSRNGLGTYNLSGGTMNSAGEFYVGQGPSGVGVFNMTGGTVNLDDWFVVGREGGQGTVNLSGGIFNKTGPGRHTEIDVDGGVGPSTMTISNAAEYRAINGDFRVGVSNGSNGTLIVKDSGKIIVSLGEFWVGQGGGSTGVATLQDNASVAVNNNWVAIGRAGGNGTLNMSGNATFTKAGGGNFIISDNSTGVANLSGSASISVNSEFWVGQAGGGNGTLTMQDSASVSVGNWVAIGRGGGNGVVNFNGGTFTKTGGGNFIISAGGGSRGALNQTGGTLTNTGSESWMSESSTSSVWNFSGGTANLALLDVGHNGGGSATLNVSGSASLTATTIRVGAFDSVNGTLNLAGGTINANEVAGGNGTKTLNFNGGTLRARADNANFVHDLTANVKDGGAVIDSNGFNVTIPQTLVAGGTGGLTKNGTGTLAVNGANTYTGATAVNAGTLIIGQSSRTSSGLTVANGATAAVAPRASGGKKTLQVGTLSIGATGALDMADNDLVVNTGSYTSIRALVIQGLGPSTTGIDSSTSTGSTRLALFDNAVLPTPLTSWNGGAIPTTAIVGKYTYFGDVNIDGQVTGDDYTVVDSNLNTTPPVGIEWLRGDANTDGVVTGDDYTVIDANLGSGVGNPLSASALGGGLTPSSLSVVPEPACVGLLGALGATLGSRRRRRSRI